MFIPNKSKMKKIVLPALLCLALFTGCSKDKKTAQEIEGTWLETKIDGMDVADGYQDQISFAACKNKKKEYCECKITDSNGDTYFTYDYKIDDKGETLVLDLSSGIISVKVSQTIVELEGNNMVIDWGSYIGTYTKQ